MVFIATGYSKVFRNFWKILTFAPLFINIYYILLLLYISIAKRLILIYNNSIYIL